MHALCALLCTPMYAKKSFGGSPCIALARAAAFAAPVPRRRLHYIPGRHRVQRGPWVHHRSCNAKDRIGIAGEGSSALVAIQPPLNIEGGQHHVATFHGLQPGQEIVHRCSAAAVGPEDLHVASIAVDAVETVAIAAC